MRALLAILSCLLAAEPASAQGYPTKPVKIVVSSSAGGSPDTQVRLFTQKMTGAQGYAWVIENQPGADGYTLLMASAGPLYVNPTLYARLPYDILRDFAPITQVSNTPNILVVHPGVPAKNVQELIAYARANPGKLRFGSPGSGSSQRPSGELFDAIAGVQMQHVPYKSSSQMTNELIGGQIELAFQNAPLVLP